MPIISAEPGEEPTSDLLAGIQFKCNMSNVSPKDQLEAVFYTKGFEQMEEWFKNSKKL